MSKFNRRQLITTSAIGAAGFATAMGVQAKRGNAQSSTEAAPAEEMADGGRFAGKVVAITGATSGIGKASAIAFAKEGATVVL